MENKYVYDKIKEPICECSKCGNVHLRKDRNKQIIKDDPKFLAVFVCPKCGYQSYLIIGDKEIRSRSKRNAKKNK